MSTEKLVHDFVNRFQENVPPALSGLAKLCKEQIRQSAAAVFKRMDLVSREEFDTQVLLLRKAQDNLALLEEELKKSRRGGEDSTETH